MKYLIVVTNLVLIGLLVLLWQRNAQIMGENDALLTQIEEAKTVNTELNTALENARAEIGKSAALIKRQASSNKQTSDRLTAQAAQLDDATRQLQASKTMNASLEKLNAELMGKVSSLEDQLGDAAERTP